MSASFRCYLDPPPGRCRIAEDLATARDLLEEALACLPSLRLTSEHATELRIRIDDFLTPPGGRTHERPPRPDLHADLPLPLRGTGSRSPGSARPAPTNLRQLPPLPHARAGAAVLVPAPGPRAEGVRRAGERMVTRDEPRH